LEALQEKEQERQTISLVAANRHHDKAMQSFEALDFSEAIEYNAMTLQLAPQLPSGLELKAWLTLFEHDFPSAIERFSAFPNKKGLADWLVSQNARALTVGSLHAYLAKFEPVPYPRRYLRYRIATAVDNRARLAPLTVFLKSLSRNKNLPTDFRIDYEESDGIHIARMINEPDLRAVGALRHFEVEVLDFSGSTLHILVLPSEHDYHEINLNRTKISKLDGLKHAKFTTLKLRDTHVISLDPVAFCGIQTLDIRGTGIDVSRALRTIKTLQTLYCSKVSLQTKAMQNYSGPVRIITD
jgi:hypothetical protein